MGDVYFDFPQAAYLFLFLIPMLIGMYALHHYRQRKMKNYTDTSHLPLLMYPRSVFISHLKNACLAGAWILIVIAFMNPKGNIKYAPTSQDVMEESSVPKRKVHDVILFVDTSASMGVNDARNGETRLENAKEISSELVGQLNGQLVSLYAFTSALTRLVPPTFDYLFTRLMIKELQINEGDVGGTDLKTVLQNLKEQVFAQQKAKLYTLVILSDGGDNQLEKEQGDSRQQRQNEISSVFSDAKELNLRIFTIGTGSLAGGVVPNVTVGVQPVTSKLDQSVLQELAQVGRGEYYAANEFNSWNLAHLLAEKIDQDSPYEEQTEKRLVIPPTKEEISSDHYFQIPLGLALLLLLIVVVLPDTQGSLRFLVLLILCLPSVQGMAQEEINNIGLQAEDFYAARDYDQAAGLYERLLKGSLPDWQRALIMYNLGNVRLAQNQWQEALTLYRAIPLNAISSPLLVQYLAFNQGLAYLFLSTAPEDVEQSLYFLQQSNRLLNQTTQIECLQQKDPCVPSERITHALEMVSIQTNQTWKQEREQLAKEGSNIHQVLLVDGLEHVIEHLDEAIQSSFKQQYISYSLLAAKQLIPLWKEVNNQENALKEFETGMALLEKGDLQESLIDLKKALGLISEGQEEIDRLFVHFYLTLTERNLNAEEIENLISGMKNHQIDAPIPFAESSLEQLKGGHLAAARFFLLKSFITFEEAIGKKEEVNTPILILKRSLRDAKWALQFNRLLQVDKVNEKQVDVLKDAQDTVVDESQSFIPTVLEKQKETQQCQAQPWVQAIPLFEKGYEYALMAQRDLLHDPSSVLVLQEQTITYWKQALNLLERPPSSEGQQRNQETLRSLEEMEAQDKKPTPQPKLELNSW